MRFVLVALFLLFPLVELALIIEVGRAIGSWPTVLLVVATGVLGAAMAQSQGWLVVQRIQQELYYGRMPAVSLLHGLMIFVAGILLLLPGFITDAVGFALLIPKVRELIISWLELKLRHWLREGRIHIRFWW